MPFLKGSKVQFFNILNIGALVAIVRITFTCTLLQSICVNICNALFISLLVVEI